MRFAEAKERGLITVVGVPYEGVISGLPGTREGPHHVRRASYLLESYVPGLDVDLRDVPFTDMGDVEVFGPPEKATGEVEEITAGIRYPVFIGGDHSITVGVVRALKRRYGELRVLYFDAHLDLRDSYGESAHSHACSAARIMDTGVRITFFGARSGTREEWERARRTEVFGVADPWPTALN
ncbi:TPA: agmatinase, partial [Candidatus Micrarchaeota archaeon]|nr:agmatinase [Candidatus Micrarchaeota archaeon]